MFARALYLFVLLNCIGHCAFHPTIQTCEDGWFAFGSSCYHTIPESSYLVALTRCQRMGASLFVANSIEEYNYVNEKLRYLSSEYYIGLALMWGDCDPKWQMVDGIDMEDIPSVPLNQSRIDIWSVPVALMNTANSSILFVDKDEFHGAICERNATYVESSAEDFSFYFWNSSLSRHTTKDLWIGEQQVPFVLLVALTTFTEQDETKDVEQDRNTRLINGVKKRAPDVLELGELDVASGMARLADWIYNMNIFELVRFLTYDQRPQSSESWCLRNETIIETVKDKSYYQRKFEKKFFFDLLLGSLQSKQMEKREQETKKQTAEKPRSFISLLIEK